MARFRGTIEGCRGPASRLGSVKSGLTVSANGWNVGVSVWLFVDENGVDQVRVYRTGGSNGHGRSGELLASFSEGEL